MENNREQQSTSFLLAENTDSSNTVRASQVSVDFAKGFGGDESDEAFGVDTDNEGNIYVAGSFEDTANFEDETLEANGEDDAFIAKLNNAGEVVWAKKLGGEDSDAAYGITVDEAGNSYVTGSFRDEVTFRTGTPTQDEVDAFEELEELLELEDALVQAVDDGPTPNDTPTITNSEEIKFTSNGQNDGFITKLDQDGNVQWATQFGGEGYEYGEGITVDGEGNTYVTGSFEGEVNLTSAVSLTANGSGDGFVTKLDATGNVLWANQFGGNAFDSGHEVAVDEAGNSYVMGITGFTNNNNPGEIYIAKIDSTGSSVWNKNFDSTATTEGSGIAVDKAGNTYFTGHFKGTATFGDTTLTSNGSNDGFVTKLDTAGNVEWAKKFGGRSDDKGFGITLDESEDIYLTGSFENQIFFGDIELDSTGNKDAFIAKLDTMGKVKWAEKLGSDSSDMGYDIAVKGDNETYVTGSFKGNATIDDKNISNAGSSDAFLVKLAEEMPEISLTVTPDSISEDGENTLTYTFTSDIASSANAPLTVNFMVGGDAVFDEDYTQTGADSFTATEGTITFEDGETTASITIDAKDDTDVEQNETINLTVIAAKDEEKDTETIEETPEDTEEAETDPELIGELMQSMVSDYKIATTEAVMATITNDETDNGETDNGETDNGETDNGETDNGETDNGETDNGETDNGETDNGGVIDNGGGGNTGIATQLSNSNKTFMLNGDSAKINFLLKKSKSGSVNEIALFKVDDEQGNIGGVSPDDDNYAEVASQNATRVFSALGDPPRGFSANLNRIIELDNGESFRLLMVKNGTLDGLRNGSINLSQVRLSNSLTVSDIGDNNFDLGFSEDADGDEDIMVQMQLDNQAMKPLGTNLQDKQEGEVLDLRGVTGKQTATFTVNREAEFDNFVGFYKVADENGGIDTDNDGVADVLTGQSGYVAAAINNRVAGIDLRVENAGTTSITGEFEGGSIFATFIIADGTPDQLLDSDSGNDPEIYFPYIGANSDGTDHIRMLGDNIWGFEDQRQGGDLDFNDITVSVELG